MQRRMISFGMMICGVIAMVIGFTLLPLPTPSTAAPALQPSPRPTIPPVNIVPTSEPTVVPMGRVTGTIIDLRTHAPAPNIAVQVGDVVVYSDSNGNYDRWVESGFYMLALQLTSEQGSPGQPPLEIAVGPGDTVVAHLFFTSPAPNNATESGLTVEAPTAAPVPPPAVAPAIPESIPPKLPFTGIDTDSESAPAGNSNQSPNRLPRTATNTPFNASFWFVVGFILLVGGLGLQFWPVRQSSASRGDHLLAELLTTPPASREELLRQLLSDPTER